MSSGGPKLFARPAVVARLKTQHPIDNTSRMSIGGKWLSIPENCTNCKEKANHENQSKNQNTSNWKSNPFLTIQNSTLKNSAICWCKIQTRAFTTSSLLAAPKTLSIEQFLLKKKIPYKNGYTSLVLPCRSCEKEKGARQDNAEQWSLFVNKTTGRFICKSCGNSGPWNSLQVDKPSIFSAPSHWAIYYKDSFISKCWLAFFFGTVLLVKQFFKKCWYTNLFMKSVSLIKQFL